VGQPQRPAVDAVIERVVLVLFFTYLVLPLWGVVQFTLLDGPRVTAAHYVQVVGDRDFQAYIGHSLVLAVATVILSVALMTFTAFWVHMRARWLKPALEFVALLPFVVPAVTLALGLIQIYSRPPLVITGTPQLITLAYVVLALPFTYRSVENALTTIDTRTLSEAAQSLGAGWWRRFLTVIVPNLWPGVTSAALLTFSLVMGEFTLALFLVGSAYETYPLYLNQVWRTDPKYGAALAILSFLITWGSSVLILVLSRRAPGQVQAAVLK
jgi:putative spermidine/putrescine transport system permease protein